jgi:hypothetical protein
MSGTVDGLDGVLYRQHSIASSEELDSEHAQLVQIVRSVVPHNRWEVETVFFKAGTAVADEKDHRVS